MFYAEIQDGHQKWRESDFGGKLPVDSAYALWVENFVEIALSCTVSEIKVLLRFPQVRSISHRFHDKCFCVLRRNSRWSPKVAGK